MRDPVSFGSNLVHAGLRTRAPAPRMPRHTPCPCSAAATYPGIMQPSQSYPSDLSDARWELIRPTLEAWRQARATSASPPTTYAP